MIKKCDCCFKEFKVYPSRAKEKRFCSKDCAHQYRRAKGHRGFPIKFEVDKNGCFICTSHKPGKRGYPRLHEKLVFRHVFEEMFEPLEPNQVVRHLCDNKMCINPEHLKKGTQKENISDAIRNGKFPIGSQRNYAKLDELQVYGIKILIEATDLTNAEISHITNIPKSLIKPIRQGRTWKHVEVS
jgi:DNA-binding transcriptional regulator YiaG